MGLNGATPIEAGTFGSDSGNGDSLANSGGFDLSNFIPKGLGSGAAAWRRRISDTGLWRHFTDWIRPVASGFAESGTSESSQPTQREHGRYAAKLVR